MRRHGLARGDRTGASRTLSAAGVRRTGQQSAPVQRDAIRCDAGVARSDDHVAHGPASTSPWHRPPGNHRVGPAAMRSEASGCRPASCPRSTPARRADVVVHELARAVGRAGRVCAGAELLRKRGSCVRNYSARLVLRVREAFRVDEPARSRRRSTRTDCDLSRTARRRTPQWVPLQSLAMLPRE